MSFPPDPIPKLLILNFHEFLSNEIISDEKTDEDFKELSGDQLRDLQESLKDAIAMIAHDHYIQW